MITYGRTLGTACADAVIVNDTSFAQIDDWADNTQVQGQVIQLPVGRQKHQQVVITLPSGASLTFVVPPGISSHFAAKATYMSSFRDTPTEIILVSLTGHSLKDVGVCALRTLINEFGAAFQEIELTQLEPELEPEPARSAPEAKPKPEAKPVQEVPEPGEEPADVFATPRPTKPEAKPVQAEPEAKPEAKPVQAEPDDFTSDIDLDNFPVDDDLLVALDSIF